MKAKTRSFLPSRSLIVFGVLGIFFHIFPSALLVSSIIAIILGVMLLP